MALTIGLAGCLACAGSENHRSLRIVHLEETATEGPGEDSNERPRTLRRVREDSIGGQLAPRADRQVRWLRITSPQSPTLGPPDPQSPPSETCGEPSGVTNESFLLPISDPRITSPFGMREDPFNPRRRRMHRGTDFGGETGTPVYATASGVAIMAGWCDSGTGNCIVLVHPNGWRSQYFHLDAVHIRCGQKVRQGQHIGDIGSTGRSTGPHLHFQVSHRGRDVDPMTVIGSPVSP